jgi:DNA-binding LytR/AlgR family response regulator
MNYKCIAVDDEPLALEKMVSFVEKLPFLMLQATFDRATDALAYLTANQTDLLFLDIQMETLTGLDLLAALSQRPQVILTTAYSEYALKGYEFEVADYLLKPYSFVRFSQAVNKAVKRISEKVETAEPAPDFFFVKADYRLVKVMLADILYIEGMRDFRYIHKSYLVSLSKIESVEKHRIKIGKALLPISKSYREVFYRTIGK